MKYSKGDGPLRQRLGRSSRMARELNAAKLQLTHQFHRAQRIFRNNVDEIPIVHQGQRVSEINTEDFGKMACQATCALDRDSLISLLQANSAKNAQEIDEGPY